jgi:hypothetical protein
MKWRASYIDDLERFGNESEAANNVQRSLRQCPEKQAIDSRKYVPREYAMRTKRAPDLP